MSKHKLAVHNCRAEILIAADHPRVALDVYADPWPLSVLGEVQALRAHRVTYQVKGYGLKARTATDIRRHPAGAVTVLAAHRCGEPVPATWKAQPQPTTTHHGEF
jgi:hypothetical protein